MAIIIIITIIIIINIIIIIIIIIIIAVVAVALVKPWENNCINNSLGKCIFNVINETLQ